MTAKTTPPLLKPTRQKLPDVGNHTIILQESYAVGFSRTDWAKILVIAASLTLAGALAIDLINSGWFSMAGQPSHPRSVPRALLFVGPVIALLATIYWLWPSPKKIQKALNKLQRPTHSKAGHHKPKKTSLVSTATEGQPEPQAIKGSTKASTTSSPAVDHSIKLWSSTASPRLNVNLFESNVPTFVLSADQHFVDWNAGFDLAFAKPLTLKRGQHVSAWFESLDNFRRIAKRSEQLYGEAILPIADRERATFKHPKYGRMVYTKIMSPIIDLKTSKIIGWTIVLNINSVHHRKDFFDDLYRSIQEESRRIRYRAAYPDVFKLYEGRKKLLESHIRKTQGLALKAPHGSSTQNVYRVLVWGPDSVALTAEYVKRGHQVTVLSDDVHLLRRVQLDYQLPAPEIRLIRREARPSLSLSPSSQVPSKGSSSLPADHFHKASVMLDTGTLDHYQEILSEVYKAIKQGGTITLSAITDAAGLERIFQASYDSLLKGGHIDQLKHQFHQVKEFEEAQIQSPNHVILDRITLRSLAIETGFVIIGESELHQEATTTLLVLKKQ